MKRDTFPAFAMIAIVLTGLVFSCAAHGQTYCANGTCYRQPTYARPVAATVTTTTTYAADSPATFLALLNAERARHGRGPLAWDGNLAAYASRNTGIHAAASRAPGSSQCWAGTRSYRHAYQLWRNSGAHWTILVNARQSVGVAPCPSGMTANAR